jgi:hypothetical protein
MDQKQLDDRPDTCPSAPEAGPAIINTVAYLILAHAADEQLRLLTNALLADGRSRVYLHLDAKVLDLNWIEGHTGPRFVLIADRRSLNWGGYSIVEATLRLLRSALSDAANQRFVLLSGTCFPLKTVHEINESILALTMPLMALWGRIDPSLKHGTGLGRYVVTKFHPHDNPFLVPTTSRMHERLWNAYKWVDGRLPYERKVDLRDLWKGSQFFILDRDSAEVCLRPPGALVHALRYALAPDEIFFTTIIVGHLRAGGRMMPTTSPSAARQGAHFILKREPDHRSLRERLFRRVDLRRLTTADVDDARASGALFARKCSADVSKANADRWSRLDASALGVRLEGPEQAI